MTEKKYIGNKWDKQDFETNKQYFYFTIYRDMGVARSLSKLSNKSEKTPVMSNLQKYCFENNWTERAEAYDLFLDKQRQKVNLEKIQDTKKRHIAISKRIQKDIMKRLDELKRIDTIELIESKNNKAVKFIEDISRTMENFTKALEKNIDIERKSYGMNIEKIEQDINISTNKELDEKLKSMGEKIFNEVNKY